MSLATFQEITLKQRGGRPRRSGVEYDHADGVAYCASLMERAIKTLRALPEHGRPRGVKGGWPEVVRDPLDAYGYTEAKQPKFRPTPHDVTVVLDVLSWITWLEQQNDGKRDAQIIVARAFGVPWWAIGSRFGRDPRTIQRWYDGAVTRVYSAHMVEVMLMAA